MQSLPTYTRNTVPQTDCPVSTDQTMSGGCAHSEVLRARLTISLSCTVNLCPPMININISCSSGES